MNFHTPPLITKNLPVPQRRKLIPKPGKCRGLENWLARANATLNKLYPALWISDKTEKDPSFWKSQLRNLDPEAHRLTAWVSRDKHWIGLHANPDDHAALQDRIRILRKQKLTVELDRCIEAQTGSICLHDPPCNP